MPDATDRPWFREGQVQEAVVGALRANGWTIVEVANPATRAPGKDVVVARDGHRLWITVKGFPRRTVRTQPATQARHWFAAALFDIVLYRGEDPSVSLAVALPDFPTYRSLARRVEWLRQTTPFAFVWVAEGGAVSIDGELEPDGGPAIA